MAILRKIKKKLKKIAQADLSAKKTKKIRKFSGKEITKEVPGTREVIAEQAKFSHPETARKRGGMPQELPLRYDQDKIVLQVRDPWWIYAYWEVKGSTMDRLRNELKDDFLKARRILRVYDVSSIIFDGSNAHRFFDIQIDRHATSWYIDTQGPGRSWCVDYGLKLSDGRFIVILRSNTVHTPLEGPSWITDEEWMIPEDMFARLYGMGFGLGQSSSVGKAWQKMVKGVITSSPGITSGASPIKRAQEKK
ncbi:MAG: DUF4912 domain-containing protein [Candidatus Omnitrophota bacterium]